MASRIQTTRSPQGVIRQLTAQARQAMETAVRHWHSTYMPLHFQVIGEARYGYQPRKGQGEPRMIPGHHGRMVLNRKYWWQKVRRQRTDRPLVWSGESERQAKSAVRFSVRRTAQGTIRATAAMPVPQYMYYYTPTSPNKVAELTTVTGEESADLRSVIERETARIGPVVQA